MGLNNPSLGPMSYLDESGLTTNAIECFEDVKCLISTYVCLMTKISEGIMGRNNYSLRHMLYSSSSGFQGTVE